MTIQCSTRLSERGYYGDVIRLTGDDAFIHGFVRGALEGWDAMAAEEDSGD
jgi:hypothetical protein